MIQPPAAQSRRGESLRRFQCSTASPTAQGGQQRKSANEVQRGQPWWSADEVQSPPTFSVDTGTRSRGRQYHVPRRRPCAQTLGLSGAVARHPGACAPRKNGCCGRARRARFPGPWPRARRARGSSAAGVTGMWQGRRAVKPGFAPRVAETTGKKRAGGERGQARVKVKRQADLASVGLKPLLDVESALDIARALFFGRACRHDDGLGKRQSKVGACRVREREVSTCGQRGRGGGGDLRSAADAAVRCARDQKSLTCGNSGGAPDCR